MASSIKPTNRGHECPICADTKGKCRSIEGEDLILCMTERDARRGEVVNGFKCVTTNQTSKWGSFLPFDHAKEFNREEYARRKAEREATKLKNLWRHAEKALSAPELGKSNAKLLSQLDLDAADRADLLHRGLSEADLTPFKTIKPWQRLNSDLPSGTPGAKRNKLQSPYAGYLCPAWDAEGNILAFQVRNRSKDEDQPKYPWLSSKAAPSKLKNGEQPLTYIKGEGRSVNLCEGILKPYVAGKLHGEIFIGAAGGNFVSSGKQLKQYLNHAKPEKVILCPDGGAIANSQVMAEYAKTAELVQSLGYELIVRWWGQSDKSGGDIDEITAEQFSKARLISWSQFKAMATVTTPRNGRISPLTATPGYEKDYGYLPNHLEILFLAMKAMRLITIRAHCGTGKSRLLQAYVDWLRENSYEEIPVISAGHRTTLGESQGEMFGIPFKTEVNEFGDTLGMSITLDSAHPKSAVRYHGDRTSSRTILVLDEADQCIDHMVAAKTAIKHVRQEVIEEICETGQRAAQVIIVSAGLTDRHVEIVQQSMTISESETLRIVNTHKRDMGVAFRCESPAQVWFKINQAMGSGKKCMMKLSGAEFESIYSTKTAQAWFAINRVLVLDHDSTHDPSNPNTHIEAETLVRGTGGAYACEIIHTEDGVKSKLTGYKIISYLMHPDARIRAYRQKRIFDQYDLVIYTNSCGTGVSFEEGNFEVFGQIENGAGNIDDMMQSTARYRPTDIERYIFAKPQVRPVHGNGSSDPTKLQAGNDNNWDAQQWAIGAANVDWLPHNALLVEGNLGQLWRGYSYQMQADRNRQALNYANEFFDLLTDANYKVSDAVMPDWDALGKEGQKAFAKTVAEARDANAATDDSETSDRDVEGVDAKKLNDKRERTKEEQQQLKKLKAMDRYGIEADEVSPELIKHEKKGLYRRLENRYYLEKGLEAAAERDAAKDRQTTERGRTWREDRLRGAQAFRVKLQQQIGLDILIAQLREGLAIHHDSPEVIAISAELIANREPLQEAFRIKIGEEVETFIDGEFKTEIEIAKPITNIKTLLKRLELDLKASGTAQVDGKQVRVYSLVDLLDGEKGPLLDYEKFVAHKDKTDREMISKAPKPVKPESVEPVSDAGDDAVNHAANDHAANAINLYIEASDAVHPAHESGQNDSPAAAQSAVYLQDASSEPDFYDGGATAATIEPEIDPTSYFKSDPNDPFADDYGKIAASYDRSLGRSAS